MIKTLAVTLLLATSASAQTAEDGCGVVASTSGAVMIAKNHGLTYETALDWVASLTYREPWSMMLATTVEFIYQDYEGTVEQLITAVYSSCVQTLGEVN